MDCTITSTARRKVRDSGFTLAEALVAGTAGTIVVAAVLSYFVFAGRTCTAMCNYAVFDMKSRNALDRMSYDIRQANSCSTNGFASTNLTLLMTDPTTAAAYTVNYRYDGDSGTVIRTDTNPNDTPTSVLLTNCTAFAFSYFQRNPTTGAWGAFPNDPNRADQCKLVQIDWTCSVTVLGMTTNSESTESAKVVIRKE